MFSVTTVGMPFAATSRNFRFVTRERYFELVSRIIGHKACQKSGRCASSKTRKKKKEKVLGIETSFSSKYTLTHECKTSWAKRMDGFVPSASPTIELRLHCYLNFFLNKVNFFVELKKRKKQQ